MFVSQKEEIFEFIFRFIFVLPVEVRLFITLLVFTTAQLTRIQKGNVVQFTRIQEWNVVVLKGCLEIKASQCTQKKGVCLKLYLWTWNKERKANSASFVDFLTLISVANFWTWKKSHLVCLNFSSLMSKQTFVRFYLWAFPECLMCVSAPRTYSRLHDVSWRLSVDRGDTPVKTFADLSMLRQLVVQIRINSLQVVHMVHITMLVCQYRKKKSPCTLQPCTILDIWTSVCYEGTWCNARKIDSSRIPKGDRTFADFTPKRDIAFPGWRSPELFPELRNAPFKYEMLRKKIINLKVLLNVIQLQTRQM